jgi:Tol biopolymer transport system component
MKRWLSLGVVLAAAGCGHGSTVPTARSLSPENADHLLAGLSPDGSQVYWWQRAGDRWQLYRSPTDKSAPESLGVADKQGQAQLFWSPDGSRFTIGATQDGPWPSVWLVSGSGGAPWRLTASGAYAFPLGWNPDGKRLLYGAVLDRNVYTMVVNVDSGAPQRLLPNETTPHVAFWSPDGSKLAIQEFGQGHNTIWLADSSGGHLRQVTTEGFENLNGYPTPWSPDGSALLYQSTRTGTSDIWVLPVDSQPRQLTHDVRDDQNASWSPDGRWVAFQSNRGLQDDLWIMPAAGGEARRVTDDALNEQLLGWRPRAQELVYTTGRPRRNLWSHLLASGEEHQLTPDSLNIAFFNLSSTGQAVMTIQRGGGVLDLATLPMGGGAPRIILRDARPTNGPWWSPNGTKLVFVSNRAGANPHAWVMDADGGNLRQLTTWPEGDFGAQFTDDSTVTIGSNHDARFGDLWRVSVSGGEPTRLTHTGGVLGTCWQARRPGELLVPVVADAPVTIASARLRPGGVLQPLWDQSAWAGCPVASPASDSAVVPVTAGTEVQAMLLPLGGGRGRPILEKNQRPGAWSVDGRQLEFMYSQNPPYDIGILNLADGKSQRITNTPESEQGVEWSADGSTLVFSRVVPVSRVTTVDVTRLLGGKE